MKKCGAVYTITCLENGKVYVGSSTNPNTRIKHHFADLENNKHQIEMMQEDYNRYGRNGFDYDIIPTLYDVADLVEEEHQLMVELKSYLPEKGYNYKDLQNPDISGTSFYTRVKKLCYERGISVRQFEIEMNFARSSLNKYQKVIPGADTVVKIARYFDITIDELLDGVVFPENGKR